MTSTLAQRKAPPRPGEEVLSYEDLTSLALDSALVLEERLNGRSTTFRPLKTLSQALNSAPGLGVGEHNAPSPLALAVYSRAIGALDSDKIRSVADLSDKMRTFVGSVEKVEALDSEQLKSMRNFCLALYRELMSETYFGSENESRWNEPEQGPETGLR